MQPRESRSKVTDTFDRLKTALADRYSIEEEAGAGGMATVYLAEDLKHDREAQFCYSFEPSEPKKCS